MPLLFICGGGGDGPFNCNSKSSNEALILSANFETNADLLTHHDVMLLEYLVAFWKMIYELLQYFSSSLFGINWSAIT